MLKEFADRIIAGELLNKAEASLIAGTGLDELKDLFKEATRIRQHFRGDKVEMCAIVNAKSGACSEDCSYCAQSSKNGSEIEIFPFIGSDAILKRAREAKKGGVKRFAIVTSGKKPTGDELREIADIFTGIKKIGLGTCASLGILDKDELSYLKEHGLERVHNNLETSERFFPSICSTHGIADKISTLKAARAAGLSICSGGIFGMGETWQDRIDLAFTLRDLNSCSTPINFLNPIKGTGLEHMLMLHPFDALKVISLIRFILPRNEIRICGGRVQTLGDLHPAIFGAGADSLMTGDYLVTCGRSYSDDLQMIKSQGLHLQA
jgi:biotin synthase